MKKYLMAALLLANGTALFAQATSRGNSAMSAAAILRKDSAAIANKASGTTANMTVASALKKDSSMVPVDGFYNYTILDNASPFNYPQINPANIRFYKRLWRDIDVTEPKNQVLAIPGETLIEIVLEAVKDGQITAYDAMDDSFKYKLTPQQALAKLVDSVLVPIFDNNGNQIDARMQLNEFNPEKISKFRIKEDIFFDKQRAKVETRIIGIAPIMKLTTGDTTITGETPAFWLYFPECRNVFVKKDVSDPEKQMFDMSLDDIFLQRRFSGKIIKESNTTGRRIIDYTKDLTEQEKEALRIEAGIEEYKKKVWGYNNASNPQ